MRANPLLIQIAYFVCVSFLGLWVLEALEGSSSEISKLDMLFTSVSASTVSSMSTVEMQSLSNPQLIVLTVLMLVGGEVFTSMLGLFLIRFKLKVDPCDELEMGNNNPDLRYTSIKYLGLVVLGYQLVVQGIGVAMLSLYLCLVSSAKEVLSNKGLHLLTFSVFTVVSTFASCGFVPTNENMVVFAKHSPLLIILIPQVLLGNTLFPPCLRFLIWGLGKFGILNKIRDHEEIAGYNYKHLLPRRHSRFLVGTVFGFILIQVVLFCCVDWNSEAWKGMNLNSYHKLVAVTFQSVNSRHTGETIVDISLLSPSILMLFVVMIEREEMKEDPLNFSVFNIVIEVISAYGNVGFTTGYSCKRRIKVEGNCEDKWIGFVGRWSKEGKIILMLVMLFGRLKKFNMDGGKAWLLL
ncbi:putative cation transporter HKT6 [Senna tora]|uniref:Putative cation transporter HKT6 n=1 Tax=Senna tora TaxID=362788 RepID=A0A834TBK3_9FABA|nr:putative cation transporter HKT6 [Senna tora]